MKMKLIIVAIGMASLILTPEVKAQCYCGKCKIPVVTPIIKKVQENRKAKQKEAQEFEKQVVAHINAERARYRLPALAIDADGCELARWHSSRMAQYGSLFHATGYRECIAMINSDPRSVVTLWMNSGPHRAIILSPGTRVAVGSVPGWHTFRIM